MISDITYMTRKKNRIKQKYFLLFKIYTDFYANVIDGYINSITYIHTHIIYLFVFNYTGRVKNLTNRGW